MAMSVLPRHGFWESLTKVDVTVGEIFTTCLGLSNFFFLMTEAAREIQQKSKHMSHLRFGFFVLATKMTSNVFCEHYTLTGSGRQHFIFIIFS